MKISELQFINQYDPSAIQKLWRCKIDNGWITVIERDSNYLFESSFMNFEGKFWIFQGIDIRNYPNLTIHDAIEFIKMNAQYCMNGPALDENGIIKYTEMVRKI
ncbi:MAG: hypothetical protein PHD05_00430 [Sphaerochaetaceae bacterium]|nr:hypothetical protein [Sphaerochaetaceae bacterium]